MAQRLPILKDRKPCYDIVITRGFEEFIPELEKFNAAEKKICLITDTNVAPLYAQKLADLLDGACRAVTIYAFEAGEEHKTLDTVREAYKFLIGKGFDRKDLLVALGGGVVGDVTGYIAATYLRGVDYIQVPTTLLAQCDSSIGGKTGVDFDGYKNMVGAFKMPILVYMNIDTLDTLSGRHFFNGFAEVMKHGLIKNEGFYTWLIDHMYEICGKDKTVLEDMIYQSCTIKKLVVEKDPYEQGDRALLNFGHTIGHAIEKTKDFTLLHGECVALGCVAAAFISYKKQLITAEEYYEVRDMFVPFYLPITVDGIDPREVLACTKSDKKMEAGTVKFVLLKRIGKAFIDRTVTDDEILEAIEEICFDEEDMKA